MSLGRVAVLGLVLVSLACASAKPSEAPADASELPRAAPGVLYAIGVAIAQKVTTYQLDEDEAGEVARGLRDAAVGKPNDVIGNAEIGAQVNEFQEARLKALARREELAGAFLLEQAAREPGAVKTEAGNVMRVIEPGSGPKPKLYHVVAVNHRGTLRDGSVFNANEGKPPTKSQLGVNPRCWQEALGAVAAGARIHVVCPPAQGYDWGGWPGVVPGGAVLSFDLELVSIEQEPPPPGWKEDWN